MTWTEAVAIIFSPCLSFFHFSRSYASNLMTDDTPRCSSFGFHNTRVELGLVIIFWSLAMVSY